MNLTALPKIELHLHLDCSLSYAVVRRLDPGVTEAAYRQSFNGPPKFRGLAEYLPHAGRQIALMQTAENLRLVTLDLFQQLKADGVVYAEIRFAPFEHVQGGLQPIETVEAVATALREGCRETGISAGLILCTLRHYSAVQSMETVRLAEQFLGAPVVGFDIASDEAQPIEPHIEAFRYAHARGIPCTAHAGEARGPESVWETLRYFQPKRLGHGVRSIEDTGLLTTLSEQNIHLEICPSSNIQTDVYERIEDHPLNRLYQAGISVSINTDARTICNVTLASEYALAQRVFGWGSEEFLRCNLNAVEHAFAPAALKTGLAETLRLGYTQHRL